MRVQELAIRITIEDEASNKIDDVSTKAIAKFKLVSNAVDAVSDGVVNAAKKLTGFVSNVVQSYAQYEQMVGGVEALFKGASDTVIENAKNAYETAGISASKYMEQINSFSNALIEGVAKNRVGITESTEDVKTATTEFKRANEDAYNAESRRLKDLVEEKRRSLQDEYDARRQQLSDEERDLKQSQSNEVYAFREGVKERVKLMEEERDEKIRTIDEALQARLDAIDAELKALDQQENDQNDEIKNRERSRKLAELKERVDYAGTIDQRKKAEKEYSEYLEKIRDEDAKEARRRRRSELRDERSEAKDKASKEKSDTRDEYAKQIDEYKTHQDGLLRELQQGQANQLSEMQLGHQRELQEIQRSNDDQLKEMERINEDALRAIKRRNSDAETEKKATLASSAEYVEKTQEDYEEAARLGDVAMRDMSDNANRYGTNLGRLQDAYQGFMRGEFRMLDNLKLGYGGTKGEMKNLLEYAEELAEKSGETADYSIDSFPDIIEAIHRVQEELGTSGYGYDELKKKMEDHSLTERELHRVSQDLWLSKAKDYESEEQAYDDVVKRYNEGTLDIKEALILAGTTSYEASETLQGSWNAAQGAWENFLVALADPDGDIDEATTNLMDKVDVALKLIIPKVGEVLANVLKVVEERGPDIFEMLKNTIWGALPEEWQQRVTEFGNEFEKILDVVELVAAGIGALTAVIGVSEIMSIFSSLSGVFAQLSSVLATFAGPAGIVTLVIAAIAGMAANSESFRDMLSLLWNDVTTIISGVAEILQPTIETCKMLFDSLGAVLKAVGDAIATALGPAIVMIGEVLGPVFQDVVNGAKEGFERLRNAVAFFMEGLSNLKPVLDFVAEIFGVVADVAGPILAGAIGVLTEAVGGASTAFAIIIEYMAKFFEVISEPIGKFFSFASEQTKIFREAVDEQMGKVIDWFKGLFKFIKEALGDPLKALENVGKSIIDGLKKGIDDAWKNVVEFFKFIPKNIMKLLSDAFGIHSPSTKMAEIGQNVMQGFHNGVLEIWNGVSQWFSGLFGNIMSFFDGSPTFLLDRGKELLQGFHDGITDIWNNVSTWFGELPGNITSFFESSPTLILDKGQQLIQGLQDGASGLWESVSQWFSNLPGNIVGAVGDVGNLLWNAGYNIISGFWDGLKSLWESVKGWVTNIGDWISQNKGPKQYDLNLLVPNGRWIMQGLNKGMRDAFPMIQDAVSDISDMMTIDQSLSFGGVSRVQQPRDRALPPVNVYMDYRAGEDGTKLVNDMVSQMRLYGYTMGRR